VDTFDLWFGTPPPREELERWLGYPLAVRLRRGIEELLAEPPSHEGGAS